MNEDFKNKNSKQRKPRPVRKITKSYLQNSGLYYLQRFAASEGHFKTVMRRKIDRSAKEHPDTNMADCLSWLDEVAQSFVEAGYINDERYAKGLVHSLQAKGKSVKQIQARLRQAQIDLNLVERVLRETKAAAAENIDQQYVPSNWPQNSSNILEYIAALKCAKKRRIGPFSFLAREEKPHDKALAILARSGFSYDVAQVILSTDQQEAEEMLFEARCVL